MNEWIDTKEFMIKVCLSKRGAQKAISSKKWKKQPLQVIKEKNPNGGHDIYKVLWNTELNQPAQITELELSSSNTLAAETAYSVSGCFFGENTDVLQIQSDAADVEKNLRDDHQADESRTTYQPKSRLAESISTVAAQTQAVPLDNIQANKTLNPKIDLETGEILAEQPAVNFENLLDRFLERKLGEYIHKNPKASTETVGSYKASLRVLRCKYRKHYSEKGEIHPKILGMETRGVKTTLPPEIIARFKERIHNSIKMDHPEFRKYRLREVTQFHISLEKEFGQKIEIGKLYAITQKSRVLMRILRTTDEELAKGDQAETKKPSFFKSEKPGALIFLDGVFTKFTINGADGKPFSPVFLNIQDMGSRKKLAGYFYTGETLEAAIDIFCRFLTQNTFVKQKMKFCPDQAQAFRNLLRVFPMTDLLPNVNDSEFMILPNFAKAGTPEHKAHLESSHRMNQSDEAQIQELFQHRMTTPELRNKKIGNRMESEFRVHLNISLEELNHFVDPPPVSE